MKCNLLPGSLKSSFMCYTRIIVANCCVEYCSKHCNASEICCVHFLLLDVQQAARRRISAEAIQVHEKAVCLILL